MQKFITYRGESNYTGKEVFKMIKSDLTELLKNMTDDQDINEVIKGVEEFKTSATLDVNSLNVEQFKEVLEKNAQINGYYQSTLDTKVTKGINTFKEKTLPKLLDEELKKKSNEGKTADQIALEELQGKFATMEQEKTRAELTNKFAKVLTEKKLPVDLVDFAIGKDEETTNANIEKLNTLFANAIQEGIKAKVGDSSYKPPVGEQFTTGSQWADVEAGRITYEQYKANIAGTTI